MHTDRKLTVRESLWRLGAPSAMSDPVGRTPLLLRAPAIASLWMATVLILTSLLALGRVRIPHVARGAVVAVRDERDSLALVFLLPPADRRFLAAGQSVTLDAGNGPLTTLPLETATPIVLDASRARRDFRGGGNLVAQLETPRLAVRVARCGPAGCLTPHPGDTFAATARLGARSLASYALSGS